MYDSKPENTEMDEKKFQLTFMFVYKCFQA